MQRLMRSSDYREVFFPAGRDDQLYYARLGSEHQHRHRSHRGVRLDVFDDERNHPIRQVRGQRKVIGFHLVLSVLSCRMDRDLPAARVDQNIRWMRKGWSLLNMVVGDEMET